MTVLVGCGAGESRVFQPGDPHDAVLRAALTASTTATVQVTLNNGSKYALDEGLVVALPEVTYTDAQIKAFIDYMRGPSSIGGNARLLSQKAGVLVNVGAFYVPAIGINSTTTVAISVAPGSQLFYVARVTGSITDFVVSDAGFSYPNGASGTFLTGYQVDANANFVRGNNTIGATPLISAMAFDVTQNCGSAGNMARPSLLFQDTFAAVSNSSRWPTNSGYDADFGGDWVTDGQTARVWNPQGGNPEAPPPVTTGFVKFLNVCPTVDSTISISANIDAAFSSLSSDATLVLYYFDSAGALIRVDPNAKIGRGNVRRTALVDSQVPMNARRIAIVPMAFIAADETSTLYLSNLKATFAPKNTFQVTSVVSDSLTSSTSGQPTGWSEFGGDYFVQGANGWTTLWNSAWGGDQARLPPVDTGMVKRFTLPSTVQSGDLIDASVFAAATFVDASSFARIRVLFYNASGTLLSSLESDRLSQRSYANLELINEAIPTGAKSIDVIINAYLGPAETSSFYAKNLKVNVKRRLLY